MEVFNRLIKQSLTIICNRLCLWNIAPRLGKLLAELVVDGYLTAVEIVDCHQLLFIHHQRVFHSRGKANILKRTALVGRACLTG